jgi:hypothetical protein
MIYFSVHEDPGDIYSSQPCPGGWCPGVDLLEARTIAEFCIGWGFFCHGYRMDEKSGSIGHRCHDNLLGRVGRKAKIF